MGRGISGLFQNTYGTKGNQEHKSDVSKGNSSVGNININNTSIVWNKMVATQPCYSGTNLPRSFELMVYKSRETPNGKVWIHANATKHMYEAIIGKNNNPDLYLQFILYDYSETINSVIEKGISYDAIIKKGNWELIFTHARKDGQHPVVKHAVFKGLKTR